MHKRAAEKASLGFSGSLNHFVGVHNRRTLVMEYIDGIPIMNLGEEIAKRGINPSGKIAAAAKQ